MTKEIQEAVAMANRSGIFDEDTVQEFYVQWLEKEEFYPFKDQTHANRWVRMTLNNLRSNEIRVEQNRRRLEIEAGMTSAEPDTAPDPLDLLIFEEELGETLKGFSDLIRETLNQYYVLGWSPQEIADFNLEGVEAVRKRITRGRDLWKNFHTCETTGE